MDKTLTQAELKAMGFSDPWPSNTMTKMVTLRNGHDMAIHVWVTDGIADYMYLSSNKPSTRDVYEKILGIEYQTCTPIPNKELLEEYCLKLTGAPISSFDIKEDPVEKRKAQSFWNKIF